VQAFLDSLPDWVPGFLSSVDSLLAIVLALAVIVGVITKLPSRLWHRTRFHRRRAQAKILDQLAIGRPLETVESALGQPHLISRAYKREDEWIEERIYRLPGAWVTVQAPNRVIEVYSITITDAKMYYDTGTATLGIVPVRLGRDTFADARASDDETLEIYARVATFVRFYDYGSTAAGGQYLWLAFNGLGAGVFDGGNGSYGKGRFAQSDFHYEGNGNVFGTPPDYAAITVNTLTVADFNNHDHMLRRGMQGPHPDDVRRG
jgi:hypothetical protein